MARRAKATKSNVVSWALGAVGAAVIGWLVTHSLDSCAKEQESDAKGPRCKVAGHLYDLRKQPMVVPTYL
jgi:hypothetical protein